VQKDSIKEGKDAKQKTETKKPEQKKKIVPAGIRGIVRIVETDLDGTKKLRAALLKIRGVGHTLAAAIPKAVGMDTSLVIGSLNDEQMAKLEAAIRNPASVGIPSHMLDRRADPSEGGTKHVVSATLMMTQRFDIDAMKKMHSYKGVRHELGLPVRGQRTRSSFRTGMVAGVSRSKLIEASKGAKGAPAPAAGAPAAGAAPVKAGAPAAAKGAVTAKGAAPAGKAAAAPAKKEEKK